MLLLYKMRQSTAFFLLRLPHSLSFVPYPVLPYFTLSAEWFRGLSTLRNIIYSLFGILIFEKNNAVNLGGKSTTYHIIQEHDSRDDPARPCMTLIDPGWPWITLDNPGQPLTGLDNHGRPWITLDDPIQPWTTTIISTCYNVEFLQYMCHSNFTSNNALFLRLSCNFSPYHIVAARSTEAVASHSRSLPAPTPHRSREISYPPQASESAIRTVICLGKANDS